jgi:XTP/dITP diphosphohydrolase
MTSANKKSLLLATTNRGKISEISILLGDMFEPLSLSEVLGPPPDCNETGMTFAENAEGKAVFYNRISGIPTVADDSGLSVVSLNGAPGVRSARWAGKDADDKEKISKILEEMKDIPIGQRQASFICCASFADKGVVIKTVTGTVEGEIAFDPTGISGFGYDPVFYYPPLRKTFAEMTTEEKNSCSHRGKAFREIADFIKLYFNIGE